jgi:hypothetical protein
MPTLDLAWFPDISLGGPQPFVMTGIFRLWMIGHFLDPNVAAQGQWPPQPAAPNATTDDWPPSTQTAPPNIESSAATFQKMSWRPDNSTGIVIESITRWIPELTEKRPGILIQRNRWVRHSLTIGDRISGGAPNSWLQANLWEGSHTLNCIANKGAEAELLGAEVYREINEFAQKVRMALGLARLEVLEVGELAQVEEARQNWVVPVVVGYAGVENWQVTPEAAQLLAVQITKTLGWEFVSTQ